MGSRADKTSRTDSKLAWDELGQDAVAEAAGRGDALAGQADVLEDSQGVGQVVGQLVDALAVGPAPVFHEAVGLLGEGAAGLDVDRPRCG